MTKHVSYFQRAVINPPMTHFFMDPKRDQYPVPSVSCGATLDGVRGHPTARDGLRAVYQPAITRIDLDPDGTVIRLETENRIFIKETHA